MIGFSMTIWLTCSPATQIERMRKLLVLIYSPVSCFVTSIFVISKEMIQNSEPLRFSK